MRATPIPDHELWAGSRRIIIGPPDGDLTGPVRAVEAQAAWHTELGAPVLSVRCALEPGDLEQLAAGGTVWLSFFGTMVPFDVHVLPPVTAPKEPPR